MTEKNPSDGTPKGELILYQTEDGRTRIECRFEDESVWLTQALMAPVPKLTTNGAARGCGRARFSRRRFVFRSSRCCRARSLAMHPRTYQAAPTSCPPALDETLPPVNNPG